MTGIIYTVHMGIGWLAALMAMSNDLFGDTFAQSLIKNKILPVKFYTQIFFFGLVHIIDDTTLEMKDIFKSFVQHISRSFFTTDTAGAIHNDVLVLVLLHHFCCH